MTTSLRRRGGGSALRRLSVIHTGCACPTTAYGGATFHCATKFVSGKFRQASGSRIAEIMGSP